MWMIAAIFVVVFFIENRVSCGKHIHIHYLCILLFSFFSLEFCNTLLCVILVYWFIRSVFTSHILVIKPYIISLVIISFVLLATGVFSSFASENESTSSLGLGARNFVIMTFWPIMISYTIPDILHLRKMAIFYAISRIIEVAVIGMIIYLFFYDEFFAYFSLSEIDNGISDPSTPRLFSIGAPNSNDAAFALLGAFGLITYQLFNRFRFSELLLTIIALVGMLLTWTRSVWLFVLLYFVLFFGLKKKLSKIALLFTGVGLVVISVIAFHLFEERKTIEDRLQTTDNVNLRKQQLTEYMNAIPRMPFFWGLYDDPRVIADKLHITEEISAENYCLEIFTRNGILAGCLFMAFYLYFIISSWLTTIEYIKRHKVEKENVIFVIAVFGTFISLFLMAQTSLFRNNLILWIMIGFMSIIKQQIYFDVNEE